MKFKWIALMMVIVAITIILITTITAPPSPQEWALNAPLVTVGASESPNQWVQIDNRITEADRRGVNPLDLLEIIRNRPDNPGKDMMPIPYLQWISGQYPH